MNENSTPSTAAQQDLNIERMLAKAYQPEPVAPDFAARVRQAVLAAAIDRPHRPQTAYRPWSRLWMRPAAATLAAMLILAMGVLIGRRPMPDTHRPLAVSSDETKTHVDLAQPTVPQHSDASEAPGWLTPRAQAAAPNAQPATVGEQIVTRAAERRRLVLPDGSTLYVNQNTSIKIQCPRLISLERGEIFIEVAQIQNADGKELFIVQAPGRDITALGTKFDVSAGGDGSSVFVTQGQVKVDGLATPLQAGQKLTPAAKVVASARVTHELEWTRALLAAAEAPLVPRSEYDGGALVVVDSTTGQQARLSLRNYHIDVHIEDGFSRTTIDQTYFNHEYQRIEGTFYFPLPPDASLSRLAMYVDGQLMEGGMIERERGRDIFETIRYAKRDPALLEWVDGCTFKMRVFPLEPRQEKRIILSYTQKLPNLYSQAEYRFPGGHSLPLVNAWSFHAIIKNAAGWRLSSDTQLAMTLSGNDLVLDASAANIKPDRDVVLRFYDPLGDSLASFAHFASAELDGHKYLMLRYRPDLPIQPARQRRDWVFLFESSANRDPLLARAQIDIIRAILDNAEHDDTFAVVAAGARAQLFSPQALPITPDNVKSAIAWLDKAHLIGALDLGKALDAAAPLLKAAANPHLIHVGAGISVLGERRDDALIARIPAGTRYVGIGVGKAWARQFMKLAAGRTGGFFTQINPDEHVAWRAMDLLATLNTPRLLDLKVTDASPNEGQRCRFLAVADLLADGEELTAISRIDGDYMPDHVLITGVVNGREYRQLVPVADVRGDAGYLPRTWARLEIDRLVAEGADANHDQIVNLSKAMYVMSPFTFTSLLVLENDAMYKQYNVDRGRKDHWAMYPAPEKIAIVAEPPPPAASRPAASRPTVIPPATRPSPAEVLASIVVRGATLALRWQDEPPYGASTAGQPAAAAVRWPGPSAQPIIIKKGGGLIINFTNVPAEEVLKDLVAVTGLNAVYGMQLPARISMIGGMAPLTEDEAVSLLSSALKPSGLGALIMGDEIKIVSRTELPRMPVPQRDYTRFGDIPPTADVYRYIIPIRNIDALQLRSELQPLLSSESICIVNANSNSLVLTDTGANIRRITEIIDKLDHAIEGQADVQTIRLKFSQASVMARIITNVWRDEANPANRVWAGARGGGGGLGSTAGRLVGAVGSFGGIGGRVLFPPPFIGTGAAGNVLGARKSVRLTADADDRTNTLVVAGEKTLVEQIMRIVKNQLDVDPVDSLPSHIVFLRHGSAASVADRIDAFYGGLGAAGRGISGITGIVYAVPDAQTNSVLLMVSEHDWPIVKRTIDEMDGQAPFSQGFAATWSRDWDIVQQTANDPNRYASFPQWFAAPWPNDRNFIYKAPAYSGDPRAFSDLLQYAPAVNTSSADVLATLEGEADRFSVETGHIDPQARKLIDRARSFGWKSVTIKPSGWQPPFTITFDGVGRFFYERQIVEGLTERAICDGVTLWQLYPDLGIGAKRAVSRFHRDELISLVPYILASPEDLACGHDVALVDAHTVSIRPLHTEAPVHPSSPLPGTPDSSSPLPGTPGRGQGEGSSPELLPDASDPASDATTNSIDREEIRLTFDQTGRLVERCGLSVLTGKTLWRQTLSGKGIVTSIDAQGSERSKTEMSLQDVAHPPSLKPDTSNLVVLPMPLRSWDFLQKKLGIQWNGELTPHLNEDVALKIIGSGLAEMPDRAQQVIDTRFIKEGDFRIGFCVLFSACAARVDTAAAACAPSTLRDYLLDRAGPVVGDAHPERTDDANSSDFITRLAAYRSILRGGPVRQSSWELCSKLARTCKDPYFGWIFLKRAIDRDYGPQDSALLADALQRYEIIPELEYFARYERCCILWGPPADQARAAFLDLYRRMLDRGELPPIDHRAHLFLDSAAFGQLTHDASRAVISRYGRAAGVYVAWQCDEAWDTSLADQLLAEAIDNAPDDQKADVLLTAAHYLCGTHRYERGMALLKPLLADPRWNRNPDLWELAAAMEAAQGLFAQSLEYQGHSLDLRFADGSEIDLEAARTAYGMLYIGYGQLATSIHGLDGDASRQLAARVMRFADRWRELDPDPTAACQAAARVLQRLGATDEAWDYLTTPVAQDTATAFWESLAMTLRQQGEMDLADRAYATAIERDPTNAQPLWDRAQLLLELGRPDDARAVFRQLADSPQRTPPGSDLQARARQYLQEHPATTRSSGPTR